MNPPLPLAARLIAAVTSGGLLAADMDHQDEQRQEAELMNQMSRVLEAQKMQETIGNLNPKLASAERHIGHAVKVAAAVSVAGGDLEKLASLLEAQGMDKEAIGAVLGAMGRGVASFGRYAGGILGKGPIHLGGAAKAPAVIPKAPAVGPASNSLLTTGTKAKLLGGGALLGAGYLGAKGLQAGRDYMQAQPQQPWGYAPQLKKSVGEFGY